MVKHILDFYRESIGNRHIVFPRMIEDSTLIKRMDTAFQNGNPYVISFWFRQYSKDMIISLGQELINAGLLEKRNLPKDESELIDNIVKSYNLTSEKYVVFSSVGNLIYISEVVDALNKNTNLDNSIRLSCLLWIYQNIVEVILSHISELFFVIAKSNQDKSFLKQYLQAAEKEEHLMFGQLKDYAINKKFTSPNSNTFLHENRLRNRIAHANCFYDSIRKEVILNSKDALTPEQFMIEFQKVKDFLFELIFRLNNEDQFDFKKEIKNLAKRYHQLGRRVGLGKASNKLKEIVNN